MKTMQPKEDVLKALFAQCKLLNDIIFQAWTTDAVTQEIYDKIHEEYVHFNFAYTKWMEGIVVEGKEEESYEVALGRGKKMKESAMFQLRFLYGRSAAYMRIENPVGA